jgi:hypothetical protein
LAHLWEGTGRLGVEYRRWTDQTHELALHSLCNNEKSLSGEKIPPASKDSFTEITAADSGSGWIEHTSLSADTENIQAATATAPAPMMAVLTFQFFGLAYQPSRRKKRCKNIVQIWWNGRENDESGSADQKGTSEKEDEVRIPVEGKKKFVERLKVTNFLAAVLDYWNKYMYDSEIHNPVENEGTQEAREK